MIALALVGLALAALPAAMFLANLRLFRPPILDPEKDGAHAAVVDRIARSPRREISILIPARNEADRILATLTAALATRHVDVEVIVLDDQSTDGTGAMVEHLAQADTRVRCLPGKPLPAGWNGKQFACHQLSEAARFDAMVFLDADVRLHPDALWRLSHYRQTHRVDLLSAFPHQQTETWLEAWLIPMMHYLLLGYLPFARMRARSDPSLAAGCGQLFLTSREAHVAAGTHAAIANSRHDGIKLPRAYRAVGLRTDVVDGTEVAECRMYTNAAEVVRGVLKNAHEGIAQPKLIGVFTLLLLGGSVLPVIVFVAALIQGQAFAASVALLGVLLGHLPRAIAAVRFRQPLHGVIFHSLATTIFVALQWAALLMTISGRQIAWRGRNDAGVQKSLTT